MTTTQSAGEREQERQHMVATLEALRLHYRPDENEVFSGADEYLAGLISQLFARMEAVEATRRLWVDDEKPAIWMSIGNHSDALREFRALTFWQRVRWLFGW